MTLVVYHCHCTTPDVVDIDPMPAWCGKCGHDIHRDEIECARSKSEAATAERDAKDLLYSLGAP